MKYIMAFITPLLFPFITRPETDTVAAPERPDVIQ
jgi:hypothetical protein